MPGGRLPVGRGRFARRKWQLPAARVGFRRLAGRLRSPVAGRERAAALPADLGNRQINTNVISGQVEAATVGVTSVQASGRRRAQDSRVGARVTIIACWHEFSQIRQSCRRRSPELFGRRSPSTWRPL